MSKHFRGNGLMSFGLASLLLATDIFFRTSGMQNGVGDFFVVIGIWSFIAGHSIYHS